MSREQVLELAEAVRDAIAQKVKDIPSVNADDDDMTDPWYQGAIQEYEGMRNGVLLICQQLDLSAIIAAHLPDLEQQAKDAARYKWLRDQFWVEEEARFRLNLIDTEYADVYHIALDEAIDAAMKDKP